MKVKNLGSLPKLCHSLYWPLVLLRNWLSDGLCFLRWLDPFFSLWCSFLLSNLFFLSSWCYKLFVDDYRWTSDPNSFSHKEILVAFFSHQTLFPLFPLPNSPKIIAVLTKILKQRPMMFKRASEIFLTLSNKLKTHLEACHYIESEDRFGPLVHMSTEVTFTILDGVILV